MKNKIDITTTVTLDEITEQLLNNLDKHELVKFVLQLGDNMYDAPYYYQLLHRNTSEIVKKLDDK